MRNNFNWCVQLFHEFPFQAIDRTFTELQTATREFSHVDSQPEFIGDQNMACINQKAVNPNIEIIYLH